MQDEQKVAKRRKIEEKSKSPCRNEFGFTIIGSITDAEFGKSLLIRLALTFFL